MILEFSCSNYRSIHTPIRFTTVAGADDTHSDDLISFGKDYRIIRAASIYGANGSGKSNLIQAIVFMKRLVSNSINLQPGQPIDYHPHKLSRKEEPSTFSIQFVKNEKRFAYDFALLDSTVTEESLYYFPNGRPVRIFERSGMHIAEGDKFRNYHDSIEISKGILKTNRLFLSCAANYTNIPEIEEAFRFFNEDVVFYMPGMNNWTPYSMQLMKDNLKIRETFLMLLQELGTEIKDVRISSERKPEIPADMPEPIRQMITNAPDLVRYDAKVIYDSFETDLFTEESAGIQKLFEMLCPIIDILMKGKILICDELESGLHESIVMNMIRLFSKKHDSEAQIIFTTHDTSLLDSRLFRRDQIWFTEMNGERSTDLYSLASIRNVRKTENFSNGYLSGRYGAIPVLSHNILDFFTRMGQ